MKKMKKTFLVSLLVAVLMAAFTFSPTFSTAWGVGPLNFVKNIGKTVEADPNKEYALTEAEGPYLIFVMAFSGPTARQDAHSLVLELRKSFKWNAYLYEKTFIHDASQDFKSPYSRTKYKYLKAEPRTDIAVLIGNFLSLEDKQFEKTLAEVRRCRPASLKNTSSETPFSMAHGSFNPMLPPEHQRGFVDPFIASINNQRPYTLLRNPRRYTVQIATFRGDSPSYDWKNGSEAIEEKKKPFTGQNMSSLEKGEQLTAALCKALRERGVEAYEFYDRYTSIVTVGSFDHYGQTLPDGTVIPHPQVQQLIDQYQWRVDPKTGSYKPIAINGIACDPKPKVIEVPRARRTP